MADSKAVAADQKVAPASTVTATATAATGDAKSPVAAGASSIPITLALSDFARRAFTNGDANEIVPGVFLGNIRAAREKDRLVAHGITHVVCCIAGNEPPFPNKFQYKNLQLHNELDAEKVAAYFPEVNTFINEALKAKGAVLIHCQRGVNRSGTIAIGFLMSHGHTYAAAREWIKTARSILKPRAGFVAQLLAYEKRLGLPPSQPVPADEYIKRVPKSKRTATATTATAASAKVGTKKAVGAARASKTVAASSKSSTASRPAKSLAKPASASAAAGAKSKK